MSCSNTKKRCIQIGSQDDWLFGPWFYSDNAGSTSRKVVGPNSDLGPACVAGLGTAVSTATGAEDLSGVQKDDLYFLRDKLIERQDLMFQKLEQRIERLAQQIDEMSREEK